MYGSAYAEESLGFSTLFGKQEIVAREFRSLDRIQKGDDFGPVFPSHQWGLFETRFDTESPLLTHVPRTSDFFRRLVWFGLGHPCGQYLPIISAGCREIGLMTSNPGLCSNSRPSNPKVQDRKQVRVHGEPGHRKHKLRLQPS